jgi:hypothetical protein
MEEIPSHNMLVQRIKVAVIALDVPCAGLITDSEEKF